MYVQADLALHSLQIKFSYDQKEQEYPSQLSILDF